MKLNYFRITSLILAGFLAGLAFGSVSDKFNKLQNLVLSYPLKL